MLNYIKLSSIVHATEDSEKVLEAMELYIPEDIDEEKIDLEVLETQGYFGNPINIVNITIKGKEAQKAFKHIMSLVKSNEKNITKLKKDMHLRVEDNKFYIRFDKQKAYIGKCKVIDGDDVIRAVFNFKIYDPKNKEEKVKEIIKKECNL